MSAVTDVDRARPSDERVATTDRAATTDSAARIRRTLEGVIGVPATEGNRVEVLRNGDEIFPAMLEAIDQAEHTIDFLTFVYWAGEVGEEFGRHLCDRARAGVRVRVLLDAWGAHTMDKQVLVAHRGRRGAASAGSGRCDGSGPARSTTAPTARC